VIGVDKRQKTISIFYGIVEGMVSSVFSTKIYRMSTTIPMTFMMEDFIRRINGDEITDNLRQ
jgi:hypothetical protein